MTGTLSFREAKPALIRGLVEERIDPVLFRLSHNYVGDLAETTALIWPASPRRGRERGATAGRRRRAEGVPSPTATGALPRERDARAGHNNPPPHVPTLAEVVETLATTARRDLPGHLADWLDALDETGRWALLKLITGNLRVGVSARLAKTAVGRARRPRGRRGRGGLARARRRRIETLFAWVEGRAERPETLQPGPVPAADAVAPDRGGGRPREARRRRPSRPSGNGTASASSSSAGATEAGEQVGAVYSRTGEDISGAFPDLAEAITFTGALDGELLILRERPGAELQRAPAAPQPEGGDGQAAGGVPGPCAGLRPPHRSTARTCAPLPFAERRARLEAFVARLDHARIDLSPLVPFATWEELAAARADPASVGAGADADAIEGVHAQAPRQPLPAGPARRARGGSGSASRTSSTR